MSVKLLVERLQGEWNNMAILYPYPFPCYLVDKVTFSDKVESDKSWLKDHSRVMWESYRIEDVVDKMYAFIRFAIKDQQKVYFNWDERIMYVEEI